MPWQVVPPSGWHFINADGTRLDSDSHDNLVRALADYRTNNALPVGDPEAEIDSFICSRWPNICGRYSAQVADADEPPKVYGQRATRTAIERVGSWAANRFSRLGSVSLVDGDEAERRASVCRSCPKNDTRWREKVILNCPPCKTRLDNLETLLYKIRGGKEVARERDLGICQVAGQCNKTAVWLEEKQLLHSRHYKNDLASVGRCWMLPIAQSGSESAQQ